MRESPGNEVGSNYSILIVIIILLVTVLVELHKSAEDHVSI